MIRFAGRFQAHEHRHIQPGTHRASYTACDSMVLTGTEISYFPGRVELCLGACSLKGHCYGRASKSDKWEEMKELTNKSRSGKCRSNCYTVQA